MGAAELILLWFYWSAEAEILTPAARDIIGKSRRTRIIGRE